jgi:hypothetical protein
MFVACGQGTNTLAFSFDGISYTGVINSPLQNSGQEAAYSPTLNIWVAVGSGSNRVAYSFEGVFWFASISGNGAFSSTAYTVDWSQNQTVFLAGGSGGDLASSTNGILWTPIAQAVITGDILGVRYSAAAGLWVMVGSGTNDIATAPAVTGPWTGQGTYFGTGGLSLCHSPALSLWMVVGRGATNTVATAPNAGTPFTGLGMVGFGTGVQARGNGCWYGNGTFILTGQDGVGASNTMASSVDGVVYNAISPNIFTTAGHTVTYSEAASLWVAGGEGTNTLGFSVDGGVTWIGTGALVFSTRTNHIRAYETITN